MESLDTDLVKLLDSLDYTSLVSDSNDNIDLKTEYPYIVFNRDDLVSTLNLCSKLVQLKSDTSIYGSITFVPVKESKSLYMYSTNALSHFRLRSELLGDLDEVLYENISVPILVLQKIIKMMSKKVLIYKKESTYFIRLLDGDLILDCRNHNNDLLFFPGSIGDKVAELDLSSFGKVVSVTQPLLDIKTSTNKINFTGDKMYLCSPYYYIESNINTPRMSLSNKDSEFISKLYKSFPNSKLVLCNVNSNLNRLFLKLNNIEYQFINTTAQMSETTLNQLSNLVSSNWFSIDYDRFFKIINLATSLPNAQNIVKLKLEKEHLNVSILVGNNYSDFSIDIEIENKDCVSNEVFVRANVLKKLLLYVSSSETIKLSIQDLFIALEYDNIQAKLMTFEKE